MILDDIVTARREDVAAAKRTTPPAALRAAPLWHAARRGFAAALREKGGRGGMSAPAVIAEVKKASPSKGVIRADFDAVAIATRYAACGAAAISVLTEERFFQGHPDYLRAIRAAVDVPLLRKDFLFDAYQVEEARAWGADAVLLIVAMLDDAELRALLGVARDAGLDALVEAHTAEEVDRAVAAGATLIGVNNRNLHTFVTTLETAEQLRPRIPAGVVTVAESGIENGADARRMLAVGYDAVLVGESLMRAADPGAALEALRR
ncbi:MAG: indole-3-glycerol phosphate synthase TrpC [Deltaproteobacteria bacterium]|nr:indole-3-glycerol phosphate synthase TrpC [Deltaproteobacteria bacterium]